MKKNGIANFFKNYKLVNYSHQVFIENQDDLDEFLKKHKMSIDTYESDKNKFVLVLVNKKKNKYKWFYFKIEKQN